MNTFPLISEEEATDPEVVAVYDEIRRELGFGMVPNIFKSMAIRPTLLRANWNKFRATILQGYLPRTLKEMVGVLISQANGSEYALRVHLHGLSALGMSEELLHMLVRDYENCPLPERDKSILRFGLLAATDPLQISEDDYAALRKHHLSDEEIFEVIATADMFSSVNAYTDSARVPIDQLG
ncbi:carboxymuconolactone decarboxylase [Kouleothrix aurantiaca]|uniref:Carboxymuconolactone decarboxylase n=1 Tax=Kouleothrix aurantiaca TaxID=186479 RepID=A0A0P9FGA8_9CHLR|nr:carboxymuconolactone decarboxylase [Kouleothrix aurantiaca]